MSRAVTPEPSTLPAADRLAHVIATHSQGALLARAFRAESPQAPAPPARARPADAIVWAGLALLALSATGGVLGGLRWVKPEPARIEWLEKRIGEHRVVVGSHLLGPRPDNAAREVGMLRLRLTWPGLTPAGPGEPATVHVTLSPLGRQPDIASDPGQLLAMSARFLQPIAWSNPGGLVARGFMPGSPYEDEELFMSQPDGRDFFARCGINAQGDEGCRTVLRHGGLEVALRFPREALTQWPDLLVGTRRMLDELVR
jgi:hypothetical protein